MAKYTPNVERENKAFADSSNMWATKAGFASGAEQERPSGKLPVKGEPRKTERTPSRRMK